MWSTLKEKLCFFPLRVYHISLVIRQSFSFQNNAKNLDLSYDRSRSLGLFRKGKVPITAKFHTTDLTIWGHSRGENPVL